MNQSLPACLLLLPLLTLAPLPAVAAEYPFVAMVQFEQEKARTVSVTLQPGEKKTIEVAGGHRLEFEAQVSTEAAPVTVVRLLEPSAGGEIVRHQARQSAQANDARVISYRICNGGVTFVSPARAAPAACKG